LAISLASALGNSRRRGILTRDYGLYKINPAHLIPGERALDLGAVVIRLDRADLVKS
jgi:hypothetical protein